MATQGIVALPRRNGGEMLLQRYKELRQSVNVGLANQPGQDATDDDSIFQRETQSTWCSRAIAHDPPGAIVIACQIGCRQMQPMGTGRRQFVVGTLCRLDWQPTVPPAAHVP